MEPDVFAQNFVPYKVPPALEKLRAFAEGEAQFFSDGFELTRDEKGGCRARASKPSFTG